MRISYWSSDVCSSDLLHRVQRPGGVQPAQRLYPRGQQPPDILRQHLAPIGPEGAAQAEDIAAAIVLPDPALGEGGQDRKGVVEGKSVSVGVDHGGRRHINKKQKRTEEEQGTRK